MDRDDALRLLGVPAGAPPDDIRHRYLALIKQHHPDVARGEPTLDVADLTEAYRVARRTEPRPATSSVGTVRTTVEGDTLSMPLPPDEAFLALVDVAASVGAVTYVDPEGGLLEVLLELTDGSRCSLVAALQGRAAFGATDIFLTIGEPGTVDVDQLAAELAVLLDGSLNS